MLLLDCRAIDRWARASASRRLPHLSTSQRYSSPKYRGRLAGLFQFNVVFGIVVAYACINAALAGIGEDAWRWMLRHSGDTFSSSTVQRLLPGYSRRSPRWIRGKKNNRLKAHRRAPAPPAQKRFRSANRYAEANEILAAAAQRFPRPAGSGACRLKGPILLAVPRGFLSTSFRASMRVLYFAPRIFEMTGLGAQAAAPAIRRHWRHHSDVHDAGSIG